MAEPPWRRATASSRKLGVTGRGGQAAGETGDVVAAPQPYGNDHLRPRPSGVAARKVFVDACEAEPDLVPVEL